MLKVKALQQIGAKPQVLECSTAIIEDTLGNPLAVVIETSEQMNLVLTVNDPDFNSVLKSLGINKVVVNEPMALDAPPDGAQRLDPTQIGGFINGS